MVDTLHIPPEPAAARAAIQLLKELGMWPEHCSIQLELDHATHLPVLRIGWRGASNNMYSGRVPVNASRQDIEALLAKIKVTV